MLTAKIKAIDLRKWPISPKLSYTGRSLVDYTKFIKFVSTQRLVKLVLFDMLHLIQRKLGNSLLRRAKVVLQWLISHMCLP